MLVFFEPREGIVIDGLDEGERTDVICSAGIGGGTIFGPGKGLKVAGGPMAGLGTSTALDKRVRLETNCLPNRRRDPSPKPEKGSKSAWGLGGREGVSVAALGNKKGGTSRLGVGKGCWITELETTVTDVDNGGDLTMLLS